MPRAVSAKEQMTKLIQEQPEDSSYDEILRELAFARMVKKGLDDSKAGRTISNEEMKNRVQMLKDNPHIGHLYDRLPRKKSAFSFSAISEAPIWSKSTEVLIVLGFFMRLLISKNSYLLNGDFKSFLHK